MEICQGSADPIGAAGPVPQPREAYDRSGQLWPSLFFVFLLGLDLLLLLSYGTGLFGCF